MLLESLRESNCFVVVEVFHAISKLLVVFLLDEQVVDGVVHSALVLRLDVEKEWFDEWDVVGLLKHLDHTIYVDAGRKCLEEVGEKGRLLLEIEVECPVIIGYNQQMSQMS